MKLYFIVFSFLMDTHIKNILSSIHSKKEKLSGYEPLDKGFIKNMGDWLRVELTYTSNAIEGNTLSRRETALIVEEGISPWWKTVVEILEAKNHHKALDYVFELAKKRKVDEITQRDILDIHSIILDGIDDSNAGSYRNHNVRVSGSSTIFPNHMKVSDLMDELEQWLKNNTDDIVKIAADLHYKFVRIHPFADGNGRTARLLFNLVLLIGGYQLSFIETKERTRYVKSLETVDTTEQYDDYYKVMFHSVERSLDLYLNQLEGTEQEQVLMKEWDLMKIGEIAKMTGENVSTIRYWTKEWLLKVAYRNEDTRYSYYDGSAVGMVKKIRQLQDTKRYSLGEIKDILGI